MLNDEDSYGSSFNAEQGPKWKPVNVATYKGIIDSFLYLTASQSDIITYTYLCARYQVEPQKSHLIDVNRIFTYLKGTPNLTHWYPIVSGFELIGYLDSNFEGCKLTKKVSFEVASF